MHGESILEIDRWRMGRMGCSVTVEQYYLVVQNKV